MRQSTFQPALHAPIPLAQRAPRRITITLPYRIQQALLERSEREGRSLSNLAAYLLESSITGVAAKP